MEAKDCEQYNTDNPCCVCRNLSFIDLKMKYNELEKENLILKEGLDYIGTWKCPKCGYYSLQDYVCHSCGFDRTMREDLDTK